MNNFYKTLLSAGLFTLFIGAQINAQSDSVKKANDTVSGAVVGAIGASNADCPDCVIKKLTPKPLIEEKKKKWSHLLPGDNTNTKSEAESVDGAN